MFQLNLLQLFSLVSQARHEFADLLFHVIPLSHQRLPVSLMPLPLSLLLLVALFHGELQILQLLLAFLQVTLFS